MLHYKEIFELSQAILTKCEELIENANQKKDFYSFYQIENPRFEILSQQNHKKIFKGFYLYITEEFKEHMLPFQLMTIMNDRNSPEINRENKYILALKEKFINRATKVQDSKYDLLHNPEYSEQYILEFLPAQDKQKLERKSKKSKTKIANTDDLKVELPNMSDIKKYQSQQLQSKKEEKQQQKQNQNKQNNNLLQPSDIVSHEILSKIIENHRFNIFNLSELEQIKLVPTIFLKKNYFELFQIPEQEFCHFVNEMRKKYNQQQNPFHNFSHGLNVMEGCYMLSCNTSAKQYLSQISQFSLILSGLCHDVKHTARTNAFEINSLSMLALRYHDKSVLEQYHLAVTFKLIKKEGSDFLKNQPIEKFNTIRKYMINNILATDIKEHFTTLRKFEDKFGSDINIQQIDEADELLLTGIIIHCADFYGNAQEFAISKKWSMLVNEEFAAQYQQEIETKITPTPYLKDLDKIHVYSKNEIGFVKVIVLPLWDTLNRFLSNDLKVFIENLNENIQQWERLLDKGLKLLESQKKQEEQQNQTKTQNLK